MEDFINQTIKDSVFHEDSSIIQHLKNTMPLNGGEHPIYHSLSLRKPSKTIIELASKINNINEI